MSLNIVYFTLERLERAKEQESNLWDKMFPKNESSIWNDRFQRALGDFIRRPLEQQEWSAQYIQGKSLDECLLEIITRNSKL